LQNANCGGDATCQGLVDARIALAKQTANDLNPVSGCFPP
jgi:hypothetical protein